VATGRATTRLATKPIANTVPISAAAHPNAESRAARRPRHRRKLAFYWSFAAVMPKAAFRPVQIYAKPPPE
jgi:hypothetical protein